MKMRMIMTMMGIVRATAMGSRITSITWVTTRVVGVNVKKSDVPDGTPKEDRSTAMEPPRDGISNGMQHGGSSPQREGFLDLGVGIQSKTKGRANGVVIRNLKDSHRPKRQQQTGGQGMVGPTGMTGMGQGMVGPTGMTGMQQRRKKAKAAKKEAEAAAAAEAEAEAEAQQQRAAAAAAEAAAKKAAEAVQDPENHSEPPSTQSKDTHRRVTYHRNKSRIGTLINTEWLPLPKGAESVSHQADDTNEEQAETAAENKKLQEDITVLSKKIAVFLLLFFGTLHFPAVWFCENWRRVQKMLDGSALGDLMIVLSDLTVIVISLASAIIRTGKSLTVYFYGRLKKTLSAVWSHLEPTIDANCPSFVVIPMTACVTSMTACVNSIGEGVTACLCIANPGTAPPRNVKAVKTVASGGTVVLKGSGAALKHGGVARKGVGTVLKTGAPRNAPKARSSAVAKPGVTAKPGVVSKTLGKTDDTGKPHMASETDVVAKTGVIAKTAPNSVAKDSAVSKTVVAPNSVPKTVTNHVAGKSLSKNPMPTKSLAKKSAHPKPKSHSTPHCSVGNDDNTVNEEIAVAEDDVVIADDEIIKNDTGNDEGIGVAANDNVVIADLPNDASIRRAYDTACCEGHDRTAVMAYRGETVRKGVLPSWSGRGVVDMV